MANCINNILVLELLSDVLGKTTEKKSTITLSRSLEASVGGAFVVVVVGITVVVVIGKSVVVVAGMIVVVAVGIFVVVVVGLFEVVLVGVSVVVVIGKSVVLVGGITVVVVVSIVVVVVVGVVVVVLVGLALMLVVVFTIGNPPPTNVNGTVTSAPLSLIGTEITLFNKSKRLLDFVVLLIDGVVDVVSLDVCVSL